MNKNTLNRDDILYVAKLANLSLKNKEIDSLRKQLEETIKYINNLLDLDISKVMTTSHTSVGTNRFFSDGKPNSRALDVKEALANARSKKSNYFLVRRIQSKKT